ncbi:hypothetical protein [Methylobacterium fujisawaense]
MEITDQQGVQAETLSGDIRDSFLTIFRDVREPWAKLPEHEQRSLNAQIDQLSRDLVRRAVGLVADRGFVHVACSYNKATLADGIKIELTAPRVSTIGAILGERPPGPAVLVFTDAEDFIGERAPAPVDKDQPGLPIHDEDGVIEDGGSLSMEQAEQLVAGADTFKGTTVHVDHLEPGPRRDALVAAVRAKGGRIVSGGAPVRGSRKKQIGALEPA